MFKNLSVLTLVITLCGNVLLAQSGTITGKISSGGSPAVGVAIQIVNSKLGSSSDNDGNYKIKNIPGKSVKVKASGVGYESQEKEVALKDGETTVDFDLKETTQFLEDIVVTGLSINAKQKELGTSRSTLGESTLKSMPAPTVENALVGRMAGVEAYSTDGAPGGGFRFRIRGGNSILGASEPLVIIDGILMDNGNRNTTSGAGGGNTGTGAASFGMNNGTRGLLAVNAEDIENVEVLKGAAAASLYGSRASSGVIVITTKKGTKGKLNINYSLDAGTTEVSKSLGKYKMDWSAGEIDQWAALQNARLPMAQAFTSTEIDQWKKNSMTDWNLDALQQGSFTRQTLTANGGGNILTYYLSLNTQRNTGHQKGTLFDANGGRISLASEPITGLKMRVNFDYSNDKRSILPGGAPGFFYPNRYGWESSMMPFMRREDVRPSFLFQGIKSGDAYSRITKDLSTERWVISGNANYKILANLSIDVNAGSDQSSITSTTLYPVGVVAIFPTGRLDFDVENLSQKTLTVGLNHAWQINDKLYVKSAVGTQYDQNERYYSYKRFNTRNDIGLSETDTSNYRTIQAGSFFEVQPIVKTLGIYINETIGIGEKLFVNLGGRFDRATSFTNQTFFYPRASLSYAITPSVRARAAYGSSGTQPPPYLVTPSFRREGGGFQGSGGSYVYNNAPNANLKPETQTETEYGIDADLLGGKVKIELTYYNKQFKDLLLNAPVDPSTFGGFTSAIRNVGEMYNRGLEFSVNADLVKSKNFNWQAGITGSTLENKVTKLTTPPVPIAGGYPSGVGIVQIREGYPISGVWSGPISSTFDSPQRQYLGSTIPNLEASFNTLIDYKGLSLRALFGGKWGQKRFNAASRDLADPTRRMHKDYWNLPTADVTALVNNLDTWVEDGSFFKLRQLTISYDVHGELLKSLGMKRLTISGTGANLKTWSKYDGAYDIESETSGSGSQNAWVRGMDFWEIGMPKTYTLSLNVGF